MRWEDETFFVNDGHARKLGEAGITSIKDSEQEYVNIVTFGEFRTKLVTNIDVRKIIGVLQILTQEVSNVHGAVDGWIKLASEMPTQEAISFIDGFDSTAANIRQITALVAGIENSLKAAYPSIQDEIATEVASIISSSRAVEVAFTQLRDLVRH